MITSFTNNYFFLSNFYREGEDGLTVEHRFQSQKAKYEKDRLKVLDASTPGMAKKIGRTIELREDWEYAKVDIMEKLIWDKFQNEELKQKLLATRNLDIIEGNSWHDNEWGNCVCSKCKNKKGKNFLGRILMETRKKLK